MAKKKTHGGKREGAGRKKISEDEIKVPLNLSVKAKTRDDIVKRYTKIGFAKKLDRDADRRIKKDGE